MIKTAIIFIWLLLLGIFSTLAVGGNISRLVEVISEIMENAIPVDNSLKVPGMDNCILSSEKNRDDLSNPSFYLREYICNKYTGKFLEEVPPIGSTLDLLQVNVSWRDLEQIKKSFDDNSFREYNAQDYKQENYNTLFQIIEAKLIALAANDIQDINSLSISNDILPAKFRFTATDKFNSKEFPIPVEVKNWVITERHQRKRLQLVDTFVLLIILGAFGSIIFLVSEHMRNEDEIEIKSYIFRPIFGILLAIATFIISVSINGLTSTARIEDIRTESIFLLAFAAGLLSDNAYEVITEQASSKFHKSAKKDKNSEDEKEDNNED